MDLKEAIGDQLADSLLKGCKVHWADSCQRVADKVAPTTKKTNKKFRYFFRLLEKFNLWRVQ